MFNDFLPGQLICRTNKVCEDDRLDILNFGLQAVRLQDAIDRNDYAELIDIGEDFIGIFLRYDPEYKEFSHVLYGEEIFLIKNSYLMANP